VQQARAVEVTGDAQVATTGVPAVTLPAGQTSVDVPVTACSSCPNPGAAAGQLAGGTTIVATSERGTAVAGISVTPRIVGQALSPFALPVGTAVVLPPSAGQVVMTSGTDVIIAVPVLSQPNAGGGGVPVTIFEGNPGVAIASASPVPPGSTLSTLTVTALSDGVATLTLRAGDDVRSVTVFVGSTAPDRSPIALAPPAGVSIALPPSVGQVITPGNRVSTVTLQLLSSSNTGGTLPVQVISSDPAVATATASAVQTGVATTSLTIDAKADGVTLLTLRAGDVVRSVTVYVGSTGPANTPLALAAPVGASIVGLPFIGQAFAPLGTAVVLGVRLLSAPALSPMTFTVTSSDPNVVSVSSPAVTVPAGGQAADVSLTTGSAGRATLRFEGPGGTAEFRIDVGGTPTPSNAPVFVAPPVGISIPESAGIGRVVAAPGASISASLGVKLVTSARGGDLAVTVRSSNPSIASVGGGGVANLVLPAGSLVLPLGLTTAGAEGTAVLTFEFDGQRLELLVVVGNVPASQLPAVLAPVVGVKVNQ
jgi:hypothetical protein